MCTFTPLIIYIYIYIYIYVYNVKSYTILCKFVLNIGHTLLRSLLIDMLISNYLIVRIVLYTKVLPKYFTGKQEINNNEANYICISSMSKKP